MNIKLFKSRSTDSATRYLVTDEDGTILAKCKDDLSTPNVMNTTIVSHADFVHYISGKLTPRRFSSTERNVLVSVSGIGTSGPISAVKLTLPFDGKEMCYIYDCNLGRYVVQTFYCEETDEVLAIVRVRVSAHTASRVGTMISKHYRDVWEIMCRPMSLRACIILCMFTIRYATSIENTSVALTKEEFDSKVKQEVFVI